MHGIAHFFVGLPLARVYCRKDSRMLQGQCAPDSLVPDSVHKGGGLHESERDKRQGHSGRCQGRSG